MDARISIFVAFVEVFVEEGKIANLRAYNFYTRIQSQESSEPVSGTTIVLSAGELDDYDVLQRSSATSILGA